jgi:predicted nucleic acid-binding protein
VKAILDTNVFVSGIFFSGPPHQILQAWRDYIGAVARDSGGVSPRGRPSCGAIPPPIDLGTVLAVVEHEADFYVAPTLPAPVSDDPDDDKFLACAIASGTMTIISGDKHLLRVSGFKGIEVLRPRAFVDIYLGE